MNTVSEISGTKAGIFLPLLESILCFLAGGGRMEKPIEVKLIANIESIKESIDMLNELNEHLKRAKDLIDELAQKKAELELEVNSVSLGDYQGKFL